MAERDSEHGEHGEREEQEERPHGWEAREQGTWLVVQYDEADVGVRPVKGECLWDTPMISVIGGDAKGNPTAGTTVEVEARVRNEGRLDAGQVRVDFAFISPALGIKPGAPEPIGTAWLEIGHRRSVRVRCPLAWKVPPTPSDAHCCLVVTVTGLAPEDLPTVPGDPGADRHVGQRNLTILGAAGEMQELSMEVELANLGPRRAPFGVAVAATRFRARGDGLDRNPIQPNGIAAATRAAARARTLEEARLWSRRALLLGALAEEIPYEVVAEEELGQIVSLLRLHEGERGSDDIVTFPPRGPVEPSGFMPLEGEVELDPGQAATAVLELRLPPGEEETGFELHVAQISEGRLSGGYTVLSLP